MTASSATHYPRGASTLTFVTAPNDNTDVAKLFVGLSGYSYKEWQGEGRFYPPKLPQRRFLEYYGSRYNALEADGTWYKMPGAASIAKWIGETGEEFRVSPKMHREVTHYMRLKPECVNGLKAFCEPLEKVAKADKLGPILLQLPPNLKRNDDLLESFLQMLPKGFRWSVEFRSDSWHSPEIEALLRQHGIGWVAADTDESDAQRRETADHTYVRLRKTDYADETLAEWTAYFKQQLGEGRDCYVYCKHKDAVAPWKWADKIIELAQKS